MRDYNRKGRSSGLPEHRGFAVIVRSCVSFNQSTGTLTRKRSSSRMHTITRRSKVARSSTRAAIQRSKRKSRSITASSGAAACPRARRPASARRWSSATATSPAISARASRRLSRTSTARSPRSCAASRPISARVDRAMIELDGTPTKGRLGANALLGVSMALARASATAAGVPLYKHIASAVRRQRRCRCPCR